MHMKFVHKKSIIFIIIIAFTTVYYMYIMHTNLDALAEKH